MKVLRRLLSSAEQPGTASGRLLRFLKDMLNRSRSRNADQSLQRYSAPDCSSGTDWKVGMWLTYNSFYIAFNLMDVAYVK